MDNNSTLRGLSPEDFANLGLDSTVYIKPVLEDGVTCFAVHNAAGTPVGVLPTKIEAQAALIEHDLQLAAIH